MPAPPAAPRSVDQQLNDTGGVRFHLFGVLIDLTVTDPRLASTAARAVPAGVTLAGLDRPADAILRLGPQGPGRAVIILDGKLLHGPLPADLAGDLLAATITDVVAFEAPDHLMVRGAAVEIHGTAIVLVGGALTGTSTLAGALTRRGAVALADGWVALTPEGKVRPSDAVRPVVDIAAIARTSFVPSTQWSASSVPPMTAALAIMGEAPASRRRPAAAMATARSAASSAIAVEGTRGEAGPAADALLAQVRVGP